MLATPITLKTLIKANNQAYLISILDTAAQLVVNPPILINKQTIDINYCLNISYVFPIAYSL